MGDPGSTGDHPSNVTAFERLAREKGFMLAPPPEAGEEFTDWFTINGELLRKAYSLPEMDGLDLAQVVEKALRDELGIPDDLENVTPTVGYSGTTGVLLWGNAKFDRQDGFTRLVEGYADSESITLEATVHILLARYVERTERG